MATLKVTRGKAAGVLGAQIDVGRQLVGTAFKEERARPEEEVYRAWKREYEQWIDVTKDWLAHVYVGDEEVKSFEGKARYRVSHVGEDWHESRGRTVDAAEDAISRLESLRTTLPAAEEPVAEAAPSEALAPSNVAEGPKEIFLVHGHDNRRHEVARFLEHACKNQYKVVILAEQPGRSRTLIERLERHSPKYAVILFTGDDVGGEDKVEDPDGIALHPRARQNVVFEFGWFCGKIGRDHVAVLYEADVELPSDISGLTYISLGEDWRDKLVADLRDAGLVEFSMDHVGA